MDLKTTIIDACSTYDAAVIQNILQKQMELLGVLDLIQPGQTVALKLNLVSAMKPDTAATTHPAVIEALARILIEKGAEVVMGDSPGGPFIGTYLKTVYNTCGITEVAERTGAKLNDDFTQTDVRFEGGVIAKTMTVTSWLENADYIINCCKLKTHGMMGFSAAVKNMFGAIPGTMKPEYHFRFPKQENFADMLIDIQEYFKPKMLMHVMDGIVGMEGNGPTAGTPREVDLLLSGKDPYALDLAAARIIGLEQPDVLTMSQAYVRELGDNSADAVPVILNGNSGYGTKDFLQQILIPDYGLMDNKRDLQFGGSSGFKKLKSKVIGQLISAKPSVEKSECIGCKKCYNICPAKAIEMKNKLPKIDRKKCIKCFCCQEFCPKGAMKVKRTAIAKLLAH